MEHSTVMRWDRAPLGRPQKTAEGYLRGEAYLTRAGIFEYVRADGSTFRELRPDLEVFSEASLSTLSLAPLTLGHPGELLTSDTARAHQVGAVGSSPRRDGSMVRADVLITDAEAVRAAEGGTHREVSCGYTCTLDMTPGEHQGERYDAVQRGIAYNHVALVERGRAGPDVRLRMDSSAAVMVDGGGSTDDKESSMAIRLDGISYEAPAQTVQAVEQAMAKRDAELADTHAKITDLQAAHDAQQARADSAEARVAELEKEVKALTGTERIAQAISAKVDLMAKAGRLLGREVKVDEEDAAIMAEVIGKAFPDADLTDRSDAYVQARYDSAVEVLVAKEPKATDKAKAKVESAQPQQPGARVDDARARMMQRHQTAWKGE